MPGSMNMLLKTDKSIALSQLRDVILYVRSEWAASRDSQEYPHGDHKHFKGVEDNCTELLERLEMDWNLLDQLHETKRAGE